MIYNDNNNDSVGNDIGGKYKQQTSIMLKRSNTSVTVMLVWMGIWMDGIQ